MIRIGLTEKVRILAKWLSGARAFQAVGTARAKALRQESASWVLETPRRLVSLETRK